MFDTPKFQIFLIVPSIFFDFTIHIGCMAPESSYPFSHTDSITLTPQFILLKLLKKEVQRILAKKIEVHRGSTKHALLDLAEYIILLI